MRMTGMIEESLKGGVVIEIPISAIFANTVKVYNPSTRELVTRVVTTSEIQECLNNVLLHENSYLSTKQALDVALEILKKNDMWAEAREVLVQVDNLNVWRKQFLEWAETVE